LFAVFALRSAADAAIAELHVSPDEAWIFQGYDGAERLAPPPQAGPARLLSWLFSHNIEDLLELSRLVASGQVVVAVPARNLKTAEQTAGLFRAHGGQWFAYTAHGNFVPVAL